MANVFTESSCLALWNFEDGALTTDSQGSNTLVPSTSAPTADTADFKQGAGCAVYTLASDQFYKITDANLPAGFPFKSGDTTKIMSFGLWVKFAGVSGVQPIVTKHQYGNSSGAFGLFLSGTTLLLYCNNISASIVSSIVANVWYYIGISIDANNKLITYYVYKASTDTVVANGYYLVSVVMNSNAFDFRIGAYHADDTGNLLGGKTDELVVFNRIVGNIEWDLIRTGNYNSTYWEIRTEQISGQVAFLPTLGVRVEQATAQVAFFPPIGLRVGGLLAEVVHNVEPILKVAHAVAQVEIVSAIVSIYVSQFAVQVEWIPLTNIEITVNSIPVEINILDSSLQLITNQDEINILIEALTLFPPGFGVSVSTENVLITPQSATTAYQVAVSTIALEMLVLTATIELVGRRKFPLPPANRLLQTQSYKRKFPVIH